MALSKNSRKEFLIAGFVKKIEKKYKIKNIPLAINDVIALFLRLYDSWNREYSYKDAEIDESGQIVTMSTGAYMSVFGSYVVTEGVYKWSIKLVKYLEYGEFGAWSPYVGLIEDDEEYIKQYLNDNNWDKYGYQISSAPAQYNRGEGSIATPNFGCRWCKEGDILEITLDLDKRTISFKINDKDYGVGFSNIVLAPYRLALTVLDCQGACFQFL